MHFISEAQTGRCNQTRLDSNSIFCYLLAVCLSLLKRGIPLFLMSFHICLVMSTSCPKVTKNCPRSCITEAVTLLFKSSSNIRKFKEAPNGPMVSLRPHSPVTVLWWQEQNKRIEAEGQKLSPDLVYLKQCRIRNSLLFRWCLPIPELLKHRWMIDESKNKIIRVHRFMLIQLIQLHWHWTSRRIQKYPKFLRR